MGYNRSQDITPYLGHGTLDKHRLIMAFSGLRSDFLLGASAALHASRGHAPPPSRQRTSIGLLNGSKKEGRRRTVEFLSSHQAVADRVLHRKNKKQNSQRFMFVGVNRPLQGWFA